MRTPYCITGFEDGGDKPRRAGSSRAKNNPWLTVSKGWRPQSYDLIDMISNSQRAKRAWKQILPQSLQTTAWPVDNSVAMWDSKQSNLLSLPGLLTNIAEVMNGYCFKLLNLCWFVGVSSNRKLTYLQGHEARSPGAASSIFQDLWLVEKDFFQPTNYSFL